MCDKHEGAVSPASAPPAQPAARERRASVTPIISTEEGASKASNGLLPARSPYHDNSWDILLFGLLILQTLEHRCCTRAERRHEQQPRIEPKEAERKNQRVSDSVHNSQPVCFVTVRIVTVDSTTNSGLYPFAKLKGGQFGSCRAVRSCILRFLAPAASRA